jgi:TonB family protein
MAALARLQRLALAQQRQLSASQEELPDGPSLSRLVASVKEDLAVRKQRHRQVLEAKRRQDAEMERQYAALSRRTEKAAATLVSASHGLDLSQLAGTTPVGGTASSASASVRGEASRRCTSGRKGAAGTSPAESRRGGNTPNYGIKFYLSGRVVKRSKVVRPPELLRAPRLRCKITSLSITPATVRMLVERTGKVGIVLMKNSSGNKAFDRCAMKHAKAMSFSPGVDQDGEPLNVWINVRVEPSSLTARRGQI